MTMISCLRNAERRAGSRRPCLPGDPVLRRGLPALCCPWQTPDRDDWGISGTFHAIDAAKCTALLTLTSPSGIKEQVEIVEIKQRQGFKSISILKLKKRKKSNRKNMQQAALTRGVV